MKALLASFLVLGMSASALAGKVDLEPGTSVTLNANSPTTVTCKSGQTLPKCVIEQEDTSTGYCSWSADVHPYCYVIFARTEAQMANSDLGTVLSSEYSSLADANTMLPKLRANAVCQ